MLNTEMNNDLGGPKTAHSNYHDRVVLVDGVVDGIVNGGLDVLSGVLDVRAVHLYHGVGSVVTVESHRHSFTARLFDVSPKS